MSRVLIAYATKKGSTREVAEALADTLREAGDDVDVVSASDVEDLGGYEAVVVGGALYTGRWHRDARKLLRTHVESLASMPVAVFAMGPKTMEETDVAGSRSTLHHALAGIPALEPVAIAVFGGVIDPTKLHFPFNRLPVSDARDWQKIADWAEELHAIFGQSSMSLTGSSSVSGA